MRGPCSPAVRVGVLNMALKKISTALVGSLAITDDVFYAQ